MINIDSADGGKMKTAMINYLCLLLSTSLALDCQCKKSTILSTKTFLLKLSPENPQLGDDVCFCCYTTVSIEVNFKKDNEIVCPIKTFRCQKIGRALEIEKIGQEHSGNWTCGTVYDKSDNVSVQFKGNSNSTEQMPAKSHRPSNTTSKTTTAKTVSKTTATNPISNTTTTATDAFENLGEQFGGFGWLLLLCIALVACLFLTIIFGYKYCSEKCKRQPYDNLVRRVRQRQNVSLRLDAEDLHDMGTSLGNRTTCDNDSHSYSSLSSGNDETVVDIHERGSTGIAAATSTTNVTVHHVASPTGPHPKEISEASSSALGSSSSNPLSDTHREILNVVCNNIQSLLNTDRSLVLENKDMHQTTRARVGEREISVHTNISVNDEDNVEFQSVDDHDEHSESCASTTANTDNGVACVNDGGTSYMNSDTKDVETRLG